MSRHAQLQKLGKGEAKVDDNKGECSSLLVLFSSFCSNILTQPCQSLFIAACAHVWHYKCIRRMLMGSNYPQFTCPNCRAITDLEAELDVEDDGEWEKPVDEESTRPAINASTTNDPTTDALQNQHDTAHAVNTSAALEEVGDVDLTNIQFESNDDQTANVPQTTSNSLLSRRQTSNSAASPQITPVNSIEIPRSSAAPQLAPIISNDTMGSVRAATPTSADIISGEGPLTPRNDAGPFVFDGSAGRPSGRRLTATAMEESE
jgi:E3 ubiquitin-protein ligase DMA1/2